MVSLTLFCVLAFFVPFAQGNYQEEIRGEVECGTKLVRTRIVGGTNAKPGAWPWQAQIRLRGSHWCGGSIVSRRWIVSAAHCFDNTDPGIYTVVAGEHNLKNNQEGFEQRMPIEKIIRHPSYRGSSFDFDLALIKLKSSLTFNKRVRPVCLPEKNFPNGKRCFVTGWGHTKEGGTISQILKQAQVPLVSRGTCQAAYKDLGPRYTITKRMRCAGFAKGGVDACQGDSGGPLVCPNNGKWYLMGSVSFGRGCARKNRFGVYADLLELMNWVEKNID